MNYNIKEHKYYNIDMNKLTHYSCILNPIIVINSNAIVSISVLTHCWFEGQQIFRLKMIITYLGMKLEINKIKK